jgi:hypothetical protein
MLAPICLFTYNRLNETRQTIELLKKNSLAEESVLIIFSDGPKNNKEISKVDKVRKYLRSVNGFKSVSILESNKNKGLANSIISGVTSIIEKYGKAIVVEDDLILAENFLSFMNESLNYYVDEPKVFSISGFSVKLNIPADYEYDNYFWGRAHSWGWATWKDRWTTIDWDIKDFKKFQSDRKLRKEFNQWGTDLSGMLMKSQKGLIDSWYIRFAYNQHKKRKLTVYPITSKVINNGFTGDATHCDTYNRIKVEFDTSKNIKFNLSENPTLNNTISKQVYHYKTVYFRAVSKILTFLMKKRIISQSKLTTYGQSQ